MSKYFDSNSIAMWKMTEKKRRTRCQKACLFNRWSHEKRFLFAWSFCSRRFAVYVLGEWWEKQQFFKKEYFLFRLRGRLFPLWNIERKALFYPVYTILFRIGPHFLPKCVLKYTYTGEIGKVDTAPNSLPFPSKSIWREQSPLMLHRFRFSILENCHPLVFPVWKVSRV